MTRFPDPPVCFVSTDEGRLRDLAELVGAPGWVFEGVHDINDSGQIVGQGTKNGVPRGFLLTPRPVWDFLFRFGWGWWIR